MANIIYVLEIPSVFSCIDAILQVKRRHNILSVLPPNTGSVASGSGCSSAVRGVPIYPSAVRPQGVPWELQNYRGRSVLFSHLSGQFLQYSHVAT